MHANTGRGLLGSALLALVAASACRTTNHAADLQAVGAVAPVDTGLCKMSDADWDAVLGKPDRHDSARVWDEMALALIRRDLPAPGVHARNLYGVSLALYEVWSRVKGAPAAIELPAVPAPPPGLDAAGLDQALHYAGYRVLSYRYSLAKDPRPLVACSQLLMSKLGLPLTPPAEAPAARFGDTVATALLNELRGDGSNERNNYLDTTGFTPPNPPLRINAEFSFGGDGNGPPPQPPMAVPSKWQQLSIQGQVSQNGIAIAEQLQGYVGAQWGQVLPFAIPEPESGKVLDVGRPPSAGSSEMNEVLTEFLKRTHEAEECGEFDSSPAALGNNALGKNDGAGRPMNPATGAAYEPLKVRRSDFAQTLAEFWADGPNSETPPGHWNVMSNAIGDSPGFPRKLFGKGEPVSSLEWNVKTYLALNGALHDAAIAAWNYKRRFVSARPISLVRHAGRFQASDPDAPNFEATGLPLVPDVSMVMTQAQQGDRELAAFAPGTILVRSYSQAQGRFVWKKAADWMPFQMPSFVTPAFPGFVSGHSTFSRAAARVLAALTGSEFFPGGLFKVTLDLSKRIIGPRPRTVPIRTGPLPPLQPIGGGPVPRLDAGTVPPAPTPPPAVADCNVPPKTFELQWATYFDAADQAGLSRLYGGIHIGPDDVAGRRLGDWVGGKVIERVSGLFGAADAAAKP